MGGGGSKQAPAPAPPKAEHQDIRTTGWGGMGPTATPQTFTQQGMPTWMQQGNQMQQPGYQQGQPNWFAAPWWGMSAANPGQALTQQDLMYQQPQAAPQPAQQAQVPTAQGKGQPIGWKGAGGQIYHNQGMADVSLQADGSPLSGMNMRAKPVY